MHLLYISPFFVGKNAGLLHRCNLMTKPKKGGLLTVISNQITKFQNNKKGTYLISLNKKYDPIPVTENSSFKIFGRVLS